MAKRIVETFVDDIDGTEAERTTKFALDGSEYEIDLSGVNRETLEAILAPYITKGRPVRAVRADKGKSKPSRLGDRERTQRVRAWAKERNIPVSERGRIAAGTVEQYDAAH